MKEPTATLRKRARREDRIFAIVQAAEEVFIEQGYEAASLDTIARRANASKATIYAHFGNKMGLFEAIVSRHLIEVQTPLHDNTLPAREVLTRLGNNFLGLMLSPAVIALYRMFVSKGAHMPELTRRWYAQGPTQMVAGVAAFLAARSRTGELDVADPNSAAEFFLMSLRGKLHLQAVTGLTTTPVPAAVIGAKVDAAVALFLRAFAAKPASHRRSPP